MADQRRCPLCEEPNNCSFSNNRSADTCWCQNITFNDELLAKATATTGNKRCLCQSCAEKAQRLAIPIQQANS
jgi:hypothetical protein